MLSAAELQSALAPSWSRIQVVAETGSTNADLLGDSAAPDRSVLVAERQTAGRGRLDRTWTAPPGVSLTFSVLIRPQPATSTWGWLPLLTGLALQEAVVDVTGLPAGLKWPNDLLVGPESGKAAGILAQTNGPAVVIGIGLNVSTAADQLPPFPPAGGAQPALRATSLALCGARELDRTVLLTAILTRLHERLTEWTDAGGDAQACGLASAYARACLTVGQQVAVSTTDGRVLTGTATGLDGTGRLLVASGGTTVAVGAGDVQHLRPATAPG
jgi:BirA family biotin operon repressor/biotin-[acetyl-CoA-carboxylase] ligase